MTLMSHRISADKATDLVLSVSIKGIKYLIKSSVTTYSIISTNNVKTNTVISWKRQKGGFYEPKQYVRGRKEGFAGKAPCRGGEGEKPRKGAESKDTQADTGGGASRKYRSVSQGYEHGAVKA